MLPNSGTLPSNSGYAAIAAHLRDWIVQSALQPGTPLPKQTELAEQYEVSNLTIGRAMRELQDDGFVVAVRRAGTFVADFPPHLNRYALIFPQKGGVSTRNRFMQALIHEAETISDELNIKIECCFGIDGHTDRESYQQLVLDIERRRLAGLLFATPPFLLDGTPVLDAPGIPRAAIMEDTDAYPQVARVEIDQEAFAFSALKRLRQLGRKRVAVLAPEPICDSWAKTLATHAQSYGMEHHPYWLQGGDQYQPAASRRCMHLLFNPNQLVRPDALIVADDNLLEAATTGLLDAGIAVPDELTVIAHANFPWPTPSQVPVSRLGFDAGKVLRSLLESVDSQRAGGAPCASAPIQPLFEDEYHARRAPSPPGSVTNQMTTTFVPA